VRLTSTTPRSRISDAEREQLASHGIDFLELPIAFDGLSVVVHPGNDFVDYLTTAELRRIWQPGSDVQRWSDVRPDWPNAEIALFSPGRDSGTFDTFTERITGASGARRDDVTTSEDDVVLVEGIADEPQALSFFGYAYYRTNRERLRVVPIDDGAGPVTPTPASVADGSYRPLSRSLYLYVNRASLERPAVRAFVRYYFQHLAEVVEQVGYIPLSADDYRATLDRLATTD
jgi:phosphate transport system substrate-binding protein